MSFINESGISEGSYLRKPDGQVFRLRDVYQSNDFMRFEMTKISSVGSDGMVTLLGMGARIEDGVFERIPVRIRIPGDLID